MVKVDEPQETEYTDCSVTTVIRVESVCFLNSGLSPLFTVDAFADTVLGRANGVGPPFLKYLI